MIEYKQIGQEEWETCLPEVISLIQDEAQRPESLLNIQPLDFYRRFFSSGGSAAFGTFDGRKLIALLLLCDVSFVKPFWSPYLEKFEVERERCGVSTQYLVDPAYRGQGIGNRLMQMHIEYAREAGFKALLATAHPNNTGSKHAFLKNGFSEIDQRIVPLNTPVLRCLLYKNLST